MTEKYEQRAKIFQQAMQTCHSNNPTDCIEWFADRIIELEAQIEKMKCCQNCKNTWNGYRMNICEDCSNNSKWEIKENDR